MRTVPVFLMRAKVPDTVSGSVGSTWARDGDAARNAAATISATPKTGAATRCARARRVAMALLRRRGRSRRHRVLERRPLVDAGLLRTQIAFPLGNYRRGDRIADHVGGTASHVEELVDAHHQEQAGFGDAEGRERRRY